MKFTKRQWLFSAALYFLFPTTGYAAQITKTVAKTIPYTFMSLGLLFFMSGCASMGNSMLLGGGIGAAAGTGVGLAAFGHAIGGARRRRASLRRRYGGARSRSIAR